MTAEWENSAGRLRNETEPNGLGLALATIGIVAVALAMTVAGYGLLGWAIVIGLASITCLWAGISLEVAEQRRLQGLGDERERSDGLR
ncbi:hypothetical protein GFY24_35995 [Nocardia sp. SYP-A9097]|nr:hypothetical protein [Nocardia sp. SYP-A9097]